MIAAVLAACAAAPDRDPVLIPQGIQIGEEGAGVLCDEVESRVVDRSVPEGALSFPADELLAALPAQPIEATLEVVEGDAVPLVVTVSPDGPVRYVEQVPGPSGCDGAWYRVDVIVELAGQPYLDERLLQWAEAREPESPSLVGGVHLHDLRGTLRPRTLVADEWDHLVLDLPTQRYADGWAGVATWYAWSGSAGEDETAATWSAADP